MSNIDPAADMTWARTVPTFGTTQPIYPTFNPPQFDAAKAYEAANSVMAGKLGNQIKQNEIQQLPTENAIREAYKTQLEQSNAATAAELPGDVSAHIAENFNKATAAKQEAYFNSSQAVDAAVSAVDEVAAKSTSTDPSSDPEVQGEIDRQAQSLKKLNVSDNEIAAFKAQAHKAETRALLHGTAKRINELYQQTRGSGLTPAEQATQDRQFSLRAEEETKDIKDPQERQSAFDAAVARMRGKKLPATGSPVDAAGVTPAKSWGDVLSDVSHFEVYPHFGADTRTDGVAKPSAVDAGAAAIKKGGSVADAQKARSIQVAGKPAATPPTETKPEDQTTGNGTSVAPFTYTGPEDDDAKHKWAASIPAGKAFKSPWTGNTLYKGASGEADNGAE